MIPGPTTCRSRKSSTRIWSTRAEQSPSRGCRQCTRAGGEGALAAATTDDTRGRTPVPMYSDLRMNLNRVDPQSEDDAMDPWPELPYEWWRATRDTLHMYTQVVGKLRLALSPFEPQWANVPLYLTARGLTTSPVPFGSQRTFDAEFDFFDHVLVLRTGDGGTARVPLRGAVADFYRAVMEALEGLGVS